MTPAPRRVIALTVAVALSFATLSNAQPGSTPSLPKPVTTQSQDILIFWTMVANWAVAAATVILAFVAVFQEWLRGLFFRPAFRVRGRTEPPDCVWVPMTGPGIRIECVYLRVWIENVGNTTARNVEVYARELRRQRADHQWERVQAFPPMNVVWANAGTIYFPSIPPRMGKHCDICHVVDPQRRGIVPDEENGALNLTDQQTSMTFDLVARPNHKGHIVGPGAYQLDVLVAADNARPHAQTVGITLEGHWYGAETEMLRRGVGLTVS
jgi:hypothetical protein